MDSLPRLIEMDHSNHCPTYYTWICLVICQSVVVVANCACLVIEFNSKDHLLWYQKLYVLHFGICMVYNLITAMTRMFAFCIDDHRNAELVHLVTDTTLELAVIALLVTSTILGVCLHRLAKFQGMTNVLRFNKRCYLLTLLLTLPVTLVFLGFEIGIVARAAAASSQPYHQHAEEDGSTDLSCGKITSIAILAVISLLANVIASDGIRRQLDRQGALCDGQDLLPLARIDEDEEAAGVSPDGSYARKVNYLSSSSSMSEEVKIPIRMRPGVTLTGIRRKSGELKRSLSNIRISRVLFSVGSSRTSFVSEERSSEDVRLNTVQHSESIDQSSSNQISPRGQLHVSQTCDQLHVTPELHVPQDDSHRLTARPFRPLIDSRKISGSVFESREEHISGSPEVSNVDEPQKRQSKTLGHSASDLAMNIDALNYHRVWRKSPSGFLLGSNWGLAVATYDLPSVNQFQSTLAFLFSLWHLIVFALLHYECGHSSYSVLLVQSAFHLGFGLAHPLAYLRLWAKYRHSQHLMM